MTTPDYEEMLELATREILGVVSPSARSNVTDDVASTAVMELFDRIQRGDKIDNPAGYVRWVAHKRAIDAMRKWRKDRQRLARFDQAPDDAMSAVFYEGYGERLDQAIDHLVESQRTSDQVVSAEERRGVEVLLEDLFAGEKLTIARRHFIHGDAPADIAARVGKAEQTVKNALVAMRKRLREELGTR